MTFKEFRIMAGQQQRPCPGLFPQQGRGRGRQLAEQIGNIAGNDGSLPRAPDYSGAMMPGMAACLQQGKSLQRLMGRPLKASIGPIIFQALQEPGKSSP